MSGATGRLTGLWRFVISRFFHLWVLPHRIGRRIIDGRSRGVRTG
jgi:hypothetical protein